MAVLGQHAGQCHIQLAGLRAHVVEQGAGIVQPALLHAGVARHAIGERPRRHRLAFQQRGTIDQRQRRQRTLVPFGQLQRIVTRQQRAVAAIQHQQNFLHHHRVPLIRYADHGRR
ncbi:hypothetical protein D3C78_1689510 [compost metagenome]